MSMYINNHLRYLLPSFIKSILLKKYKVNINCIYIVLIMFLIFFLAIFNNSYFLSLIYQNKEVLRFNLHSTSYMEINVYFIIIFIYSSIKP